MNDLEVRAEKASPTLAAALARYDRALAAARVERADLFPTVVAGSDASRQRVSGGRFGGDGNPRTYNDFSVGGALDYEIDLWGRIRNGVASARADAEASEADLASARLSLQAAVADAYARLRGLDAQADLLRQTVEALEKAYDLTVRRHDGGIASGIDVNRARTVLGNARAQISAVAAERAATEHEIAALVGELASNFSIPPAVQTTGHSRPARRHALAHASTPTRHRRCRAAHGRRQCADRRGACGFLPDADARRCGRIRKQPMASCSRRRTASGASARFRRCSLCSTAAAVQAR